MKTKKTTSNKRFYVIDHDHNYDPIVVKATNTKKASEAAIELWDGAEPRVIFVYEMINPHTVTIARTLTVTKGAKNDIED